MMMIQKGWTSGLMAVDSGLERFCYGLENEAVGWKKRPSGLEEMAAGIMMWKKRERCWTAKRKEGTYTCRH